jgi:capsid protein
MMIPMFCNVAWEWFTTQMFIAGKISSPVTASWTTPSREMIDPTKEIAAAAEAVRNGFKSRSSVIREHGSDPEEVLQEIVDDNASADKDELKFDSDSRFRTGVKAVLEAPAEVQDTE